MDKSYNDKTDRLLDAIRKCGPGWVSRSQIAAQLGKGRLTGPEAMVLSSLVAMGVLEAERHEINGPIPTRWEYRLR